MEKHELAFVTSTCTMSCNVVLHDCTRHTGVESQHLKALRLKLQPILQVPRVSPVVLKCLYFCLALILGQGNMKPFEVRSMGRNSHA
jgi:hypothetical protein